MQFQILGLSNFHQLSWHSGNASFKDTKAMAFSLYTEWENSVNFHSCRIKGFGSRNSVFLSGIFFILYHNYLAFSDFLCVLQIFDLTTSGIILKDFIVLAWHRSGELQGRSFISCQSIWKPFSVPFSLLVSLPFSRIIHTPLKISVTGTQKYGPSRIYCVVLPLHFLSVKDKHISLDVPSLGVLVNF